MPRCAWRGSLTCWKETREKQRGCPAGVAPAGRLSHASNRASRNASGAAGREARRRCRSDTRSIQGRAADAWAPGGDEGRDKLRKARGSRKWALIPGCPNGATRPAGGRPSTRVEANPPNRNIQVGGGRENNSDTASSGERKRQSPNPGRRGAPGVVGPPRDAERIAEDAWKGAPQWVTVPYAKSAGRWVVS